MRGLLIIDAANVVGSVPDGWWRDRAGAAARLRDALAGHPDSVEVVLVVEGAARDTASIPRVRAHPAPGSGDDAIVELVQGAGGAATVVTADRLLRERVRALGAEVIGPRELRSADWFTPRDGGPGGRRTDAGSA